jgi:pimeloyl-ACP methyl ester carboxylesterase
MRLRLLIFGVGFLILTGIVSLVGGIYLAEGAVRRHPVLSSGRSPDRISLPVDDGAVLVARFENPPVFHGRCVLLLHGSGSSHRAMQGLAGMFRQEGYATLTPDSRGHGESGGDFVTYGLREAVDLSRWLDWLSDGRCRDGVYALGESMGAAALLTMLPREARIKAAVAESAFASFETVAGERIGRRIGIPLLGRAFVSVGLSYLQLRYGFDLQNIPPLATTSTPILFIHGLRDEETVPEHSRKLRLRYSNSSLWEVEGAGHCGAFAAAPQEFRRRVLDWFAGTR